MSTQKQKPMHQQSQNRAKNPHPDKQESPSRKMPKEVGGPKGPEPTRYGDWEKDGRCSDF